MLSRSFVANIDACRVEAEIADDTGNVLAIVYEDESGWHVEFFGNGSRFSAEITDQFLQEVKTALAAYVNRTGLNAPEGLTRGGLALWLMKKNDGTAMGMPIE